jgi:two-component sensor histidine kinase
MRIWSRRLTALNRIQRAVPANCRQDRRSRAFQRSTPVTHHETSQLLPPAAASIVLARRAVDALPLPRVRAGEVKLIVSELVTNSIEHGRLTDGDRIEIHARVSPGGALYVEVRDPGPGPPANARCGLGWRILERLADRWGVDHCCGQARVWFELDPQ